MKYSGVLIGLLSVLLVGSTSFGKRPPVPLYDLNTRARPVVSGTFEQPLNPDDPNDSRTYMQRYFIDNEYAEGGGGGSVDSPVLFFLCGEWSCSIPASSPFMNYARELKAHIIALEHRYYGKSLPFQMMTAENLKYLSADFALKDAARFEKWAVSKFKFTGKWIVVGASYSATLAAYYRLKYPDLVVGALASSAPVRALLDFKQYDSHAAKNLPPECLARVKKAVTAIENSMNDQTQFQTVKTWFGGDKIEDPLDFLWIVADSVAAAVQYGQQDGFCSMLKDDNLLESYGNAAQDFFASQGGTFSDSYQAALEEDVTKAADPALRPWYYQSCTDFGFWQTYSGDAAWSARSSKVDLNFFDHVCDWLFHIEQPANVQSVNGTYYEPLMDSKQSSNIIFTNGSVDPWSELSLSHVNGNDANPLHSYFISEGGSHCEDLGGGSTPALDATRAATLAKLKEFVGATH